MSFIERNKAWVLPLLGVVAVGVIYMNVKMLGPSAKTAANKPVGTPTAAPPTPAATPTSAQPTPPAPVVAAPVSGTPDRPGTADLWSDLRVLEEPWAGLNQTETLLNQGAQALGSDALHPAPRISLPPVAIRVPEPLVPRVETPSKGPVRPVQPAPEVDFLIRNPKGSTAWVGGAGFREGQQLGDGWRVRRITGDMVEVEGPGGVVRRWTNSMKAKSLITHPTPEAP